MTSRTRCFTAAEKRWDMIIAFPPCTYISNMGAARLFPSGQLNQERYQKGLAGKEFFLQFFNADCELIAIENPVPSSIFQLPKYTQIIQPWQFGHPYTKRTCLWLRGLPPLRPTNIVQPECNWVSGGSKKSDGTRRKTKSTGFRDGKTRSKTFPGIAEAMANQWGSLQ
jgi:hypothetical protein